MKDKIIKSKSDCIEYLKWRISAEKAYTRWSGITMWILLASIGYFVKEMVFLVEQSSLFEIFNIRIFLISFLLVNLLIFTYSNMLMFSTTGRQDIRKYTFDIRVMQIVLLLVIAVYFLTERFVDIQFRTKISFAQTYLLMIIQIMFVENWILSNNRLLMLKLFPQNTYINIAKFKKQLSLGNILSTILKIALFIAITILYLWILKNEFSYGVEGTIKDWIKPNIVMFYLYIFICISLLMVLGNMQINKQGIKRLMILHDQLVWDKKKIGDIEAYISKTFYDSQAFSKYSIKRIKKEIKEIEAVEMIDEDTALKKEENKKAIRKIRRTLNCLLNKYYRLINCYLSSLKKIDMFENCKYKKRSDEFLQECFEKILEIFKEKEKLRKR